MKKNSIHIAVTCLFLCLLTGTLHAQLGKTFSKGTVTLQSGETLRGYIRNDELAKMNYRVNFKAAAEDKNTVVYDTSTVKKLVMEDGDVFEYLRFQEQESGTNLAVLAKLLIRGKASLYKMIYKSDETFYLLNSRDSLYLLRNDKMDAGMTATDETLYHFKEILFGALAGANISADEAERISFTQSDIGRLVLMYNKTMGGENTVVTAKEQSVHYVVIGAGGMLKNSAENELYLEAVYRTYIPKISKGTSFNVGLRYYKYKFAETVTGFYFSTTTNYRSTLVTLPVYLQQNILNKNIRPFLFAGLNASYWKVRDQYDNEVAGKGIKGNVGIAFLFGGGIEANVYKGITLNASYRYENYGHLVLAGISYIFSTGKK